MSGDWSKVVQSVGSVVTPDLLADENTILKIVAYAAMAKEVEVERGGGESGSIIAAGLLKRLERDYKPGGITVFRSAFEKAEEIVSRTLGGELKDVPLSNIDIKILLFTDGRDTSIWTGASCDKKASEESARKHYDQMRSFLSKVGCAVCMYVAAYTQHHNPEQCQYFSDHYCYIDRAVTLEERLSSLMGEILTGTGFCTLSFGLPKGVSLAEPLPDQLPIDHGQLDYYVWLKVREGVDVTGSRLELKGEIVGNEPLKYSGSFNLHAVSPNTYLYYMFVCDKAAYTLRQLSRGIPDNPTSKHITNLRSELDVVRSSLFEARQVACAPFHGVGINSIDQQLEFLQKGKSVHLGAGGFRKKIQLQLQHIDTLADRLSHVVWNFERNCINSVQINAILGESRQHLPTRVQKRLNNVCVANALRIRERDQLLASLPPSSLPLSKYGKHFTTDFFSHCDALEAAHDGDAHFFFLSAFEYDPNREKAVEVEDGLSFISLEAFTFLKHATMKKKKTTKISIPAVGCDVAGVWLPCYFTEHHFQTAKLLLPDALGLLLHHDPLGYSSGDLMQIFEVFGRTTVEKHGKERTEHDWTMFLHKIRSLWAVANESIDERDGQKYLDHSYKRVSGFLNNPINREKTGLNSMYRLVADALLVDSTNSSFDWQIFLQYLYLQIVGQGVHSLLKAKAISPLVLQRGLLGLGPQECESSEFEICSGLSKEFKSRDEMEEVLLKQSENTALIEQTVDYFLGSLKGIEKEERRDGRMSVEEWSGLVSLVGCWHSAQQEFGGLHAIFSILDNLMTDENPEHQSSFDSLIGFLKSRSIEGVDVDKEAVRGTLLQCSILPDLPSLLLAIQNSAATTIQTAWWAHSHAKRIPRGCPSQWKWVDPLVHPSRVSNAAFSFVIFSELRKMKVLEKKERKYRKILEKRGEYAVSHCIRATLPLNSMYCWCGELFTPAHRYKVWGNQALPDDPSLFEKARRMVLKKQHYLSAVEIDSQSVKQYYLLGGSFSFAPGDTYIPGLHERTKMLQIEWKRKGIRKPVEAAVEEMLMRLRWDKSVPGAKRRLSNIIAFLWDPGMSDS
eukprot:CAMPEP_0174258760 /NCGR_PEP_ID=MMETSP0439-20130205/7696_1 /TAXON_ID=0 /ORGANISM="Stereomyxa ramosa, Strain Chinc5" /LENGTH=1072 /DNA_ID=CAMNT_0015342387 /DNA_START=177 /DNA_END=3391 /DNA_ORIENTATION=-